jgi:hypothetical protein
VVARHPTETVIVHARGVSLDANVVLRQEVVA